MEGITPMVTALSRWRRRASKIGRGKKQNYVEAAMFRRAGKTGASMLTSVSGVTDQLCGKGETRGRGTGCRDIEGQISIGSPSPQEGVPVVR